MEQFEATELACRCRDLERQAFETVGAMVTAVSDAELKIRLSEVSRHHAWRADQWASLAAAPQPEGGATIVASAGSPVEQLLAAAPPDGAEQDVVRGWLHEVLDAFVEVVDEVAARCVEVGDGPMRRVASRVGHDLRADRGR